MMLLDVFLEGLFEMDLRRVNSEEVRGASRIPRHKWQSVLPGRS